MSSINKPQPQNSSAMKPELAYMKEREILEKIALVIESLPSENLLAKCWTEEQKEEWHKRRSRNILIAKAWREQFNLIKGYSLDIAVDNQEIDELEKEAILLFIKCHHALWEIVKIVEPDVHYFHSFIQSIVSIANYFSWLLPQIFIDFFWKILSQKYSFDSPYELFATILKENDDDDFSLCLRPYQEISLKKLEQGTELVNKFLFKGMEDGFYYQPNSDEIKQIKNYFPWEYFSASWLVMVLAASQFAVLGKPQLMLKLKEFNDLVIECNYLSKTACRKRKSKTWDKRRSVAWDRGRKKYAKKGGAY